MATSRPFAYNNTGVPISGTEQIGEIAIGWPDRGFEETGLEWWEGPDEELGYVIAKPISDDSQPTPVGITASIAFSRTDGFDRDQFIDMATLLTGMKYNTADEAKIGLNDAGYWTSYYSTISLIMDLDSTLGVDTRLSTWEDSSRNGNDAAIIGAYQLNTSNGYQVVELLGGSSGSSGSSGSGGYVYPSRGFGDTLDRGFTYEVWALSSNTGDGTLIGEWGGAPPNGWTDAQMAFVSGTINSGVYPSGNFTPFPGFIKRYAFASNKWYNIVMTYDGTDLTQYVNGVSMGVVSGTKGDPSDRHLTLGLPDGAGGYIGGANGYFGGYIGSWRIWNGALTAGEVLNNFNATKYRFGF